MNQLFDLSNRDYPKTLIKNCEHCGGEFEVEINGFNERLLRYCGTCLNVMEENSRVARQKEGRDHRKHEWIKFCPLEFQETVLEKLPNPRQTAVILSWQRDSKGLILYGATRRGKSRSLWLLLKTLFITDGIVPVVLDSTSQFEFNALYAEGSKPVYEWVRKAQKSPLLVMDDVFKSRMTESYESALFAIIDYRQTHRLPLMVTLNDTSKTLKKRLSADRGDALIARLVEMCELVQF